MGFGEWTNGTYQIRYVCNGFINVLEIPLPNPMVQVGEAFMCATFV
jgi:hypothetical protein